MVENNEQKQTSEVRLYIEPVGKGWGWGGEVGGEEKKIQATLQD